MPRQQPTPEEISTRTGITAAEVASCLACAPAILDDLAYEVGRRYLSRALSLAALELAELAEDRARSTE
jgi:predicted outer membrane lipoprotein